MSGACAPEDQEARPIEETSMELIQEEERGIGKMSKELTLTDQNFDSEISGTSEPVLVDFWAPWCAPCRFVAPVLEELAEDYSGTLKIAKVNVDDNPMTASRFGITSIPSLLLFKNGQMVDQWVGAMPRQMLEGALKPHLTGVN